MKAPWILICATLPLWLVSCGKSTSESDAEQVIAPPAATPSTVASAPAVSREDGKTPMADDKDTPSQAAAADPAGATTAVDQPPQLALARESGCLACHSIKKKVVGPAWKDVAKRYAGDAEAKARLIAKIKSGGKGNWTQVTGGATMPPYSPRVSDENIETLVEFVLSLAD